MGPFRCGLILAVSLAAAAPAFAQDVNPTPGAPAFPPTVAPEVDPDLPAQIPATPPADSGVAPAPAPAPTPAARPPAKPKKPAPQIPTARGTVVELDKVAMTIKVDVRGEKQVFKITSGTRLYADTRPAIFSDGKVGDKVVVEHRAGKDKTREAISVRFSGAAKPAGAPAP